MLSQTDINTIADMLAEKIMSAKHLGRWLSIDEAMEYARVKSRSTIMVWINSGYIYAHKRTGSWIVDRDSIDKWFLSSR